MKTTVSQYARVFDEISRSLQGSDDAARTAAVLFGFLKRKRELRKLPNIIRSMQTIADGRNESLNVSVATAFPMNASLKKEMELFVKEVFGGKNVSLETRVDPSLIGGFVLRTETNLFDASTGEKLRRINNALKK